MKNRIFVALVAGLALTVGAASASAAFIDGDITFSGDFDTMGGTLGTTTGIDFLGDDFTVDDATGDFASAGIGAGSVGFFQDFVFNPLNPATTDPLWSIGGFDFALEAVSIVFQSDMFLVLSGTGTLSSAGFDDTFGTWNLSGNAAGSLFNFSSGSTSEGIPAPATLLLIGLGLAGFAASRRAIR